MGGSRSCPRFPLPHLNDIKGLGEMVRRCPCLCRPHGVGDRGRGQRELVSPWVMPRSRQRAAKLLLGTEW